MFASREGQDVESPLTLDEHLGALRAHLHAVLSVPPSSLSPSELSDALVALHGARNQLDAAISGVASVWDAQSVWALDGARSGATWLASHTEASRPAAGGELKTARALRTMPCTAEAFANGSLGAAKVRLLANAAAQAPELFAAHEAVLVEEALALRVDQVAHALAFWAAHANPDGAADRAARRHERRAVHLSQTLDGMWRLDGILTPEDGEVLHRALTRITDALFAAEKATADASNVPVTTTPAQRRADALTLLAMQGAAADEAGVNLNTPSISALIDLPTMADPATGPHEPAGETMYGSPVAAETARRWTCDARIARIILGPGSAPVDLGTASRLPSPALRRALVARDRGCVFPGCDQPAHRTHAHHIVHWSAGGGTDRHNLVLLCPAHHHAVHEGGFGLRRHRDGALRFTRPDGTPLTVPKGKAPPPTCPWPHAA